MNKLVIKITPIGKPRMTQRDKWAKRSVIERYYAWCNSFKILVKNHIPYDINNLSWIAYFPLPRSWSKKQKAKMTGQLHRQKPDRDNVDKAILDALLKEDCTIASGRLEKRWDDGDGPRIELSWYDKNEEFYCDYDFQGDDCLYNEKCLSGEPCEYKKLNNRED